MSDWEKTVEVPPSRDLEVLVAQLIDAQARKAIADADVEGISAKMKALFPTGIGEFAADAGRYIVTLKRGDKYTWDTKKLEGLFISKTMPEYVKRRLSIDKRTYQRLDADEQDRLAEALTVEPGSVKIEIVEKTSV
jgi:hypothetical protein